VTAGVGLSSAIATKLVPRTGTRPVLVAGTLLGAAGVYWLSRITAGFQAALLACAIVLVAAAVIATRAAGTRQQLAAAQPAPGPETMAKAA